MPQKPSYEKWLEKVDEEMEEIAGVVSEDLDDCTLLDYYDEGQTPHEAAENALYANDFPG